MAYVYEFINKQEISDFIKYTLKLTDTDGIFPEKYIPVILEKINCNLDELDKIAKNMINHSILEYELLKIKEISFIEENKINTSSENVLNSSIDELNTQ